MLIRFCTHEGEIVQGERLQDALNAVADDYIKLAHEIREEDAYASHVSEAEKDDELTWRLSYAETIRQGGAEGLTVWQWVNEKLTGKCVALLGGGE